jgi:hypothetical protein
MELKQVAIITIGLSVLVLILHVLFRSTPKASIDSVNTVRPLAESSITWCRMEENSKYDLTRGAFCENPEALATTLESYENFSAKIEHVLMRRSMLVESKHINNYFWGPPTWSGANNAYTMLKWGILHLHPRQDDLWLEFGVSEGFSVNLTAALRGPNASEPIHAFDSFLGLPEDWNGVFKKGMFSLKGISPPLDPNVQLHVGWFNETLEPFFQAHPGHHIAYVNLDMDLYSGALYVLKQIMPRFRAGTVLHFHELVKYNDASKTLRGDQEMRALYDALKQSPTPVVLQLMPFYADFREPVVLRVSAVGY